MNERVKELRAALSLTSEAFGARLGVTKAAISKIENGSRSVTDQMVLSICREFHVNERWLRTGEGEMFIPQDRNSEIAAFVGKVMAGETDSFKSRFISALSRLDENDWVVIEEFAKKLSRGE